MKVIPNAELFDNIFNQIGNNDKNSIVLNKLTNGNLKESSKGMLSIMEILNRNDYKPSKNTTSDNSTVNLQIIKLYK